jgi:GxxExxY protein
MPRKEIYHEAGEVEKVKKKGIMVTPEQERIAKIVLDAAFKVHSYKVLIENKSVKEVKDIHVAQLLGYLRLSGISLGFLFNFNVRSFKDGIRRIVLNDELVPKPGWFWNKLLEKIANSL